jgi:hypothetical protein
MSFLYPRTVAVHRSQTNATSSSVGLVGYSGREAQPAPADPEGELVLFTGLPAQIFPRATKRSQGELPSDVVTRAEWQICIPAASLPQYSLRDRDIFVDDENYRYQAQANYWTPLGYQVFCIRLEA